MKRIAVAATLTALAMGAALPAFAATAPKAPVAKTAHAKHHHTAKTAAKPTAKKAG